MDESKEEIENVKLGSKEYRGYLFCRDREIMGWLFNH